MNALKLFSLLGLLILPSLGAGASPLQEKSSAYPLRQKLSPADGSCAVRAEISGLLAQWLYGLGSPASAQESKILSLTVEGEQIGLEFGRGDFLLRLYLRDEKLGFLLKDFSSARDRKIGSAFVGLLVDRLSLQISDAETRTCSLSDANDCYVRKFERVNLTDITCKSVGKNAQYYCQFSAPVKCL